MMIEVSGTNAASQAVAWGSANGVPNNLRNFGHLADGRPDCVQSVAHPSLRLFTVRPGEAKRARATQGADDSTAAQRGLASFAQIPVALLTSPPGKDNL